MSSSKSVLMACHARREPRATSGRGSGETSDKFGFAKSKVNSESSAITPREWRSDAGLAGAPRIALDCQKRLIKDEHISEGTIDEASVHPREVIHHALDGGANALILVHNHPSGSLEPNRADIQLTHRIAEAGRPLRVTVQDHLIVGREGHVSLRAKGLI